MCVDTTVKTVSQAASCLRVEGADDRMDSDGDHCALGYFVCGQRVLLDVVSAQIMSVDTTGCVRLRHVFALKVPTTVWMVTMMTVY